MNAPLYPRYQFDAGKLREAVLFICGECDAPDLGLVKLNKTLYYSDMIKFVGDGHPLTGETYIKLRHGPVAKHLSSILRDMQNDRDILIRDVDYYGFVKKELTATREADASRFNGVELSILREVIDFVCRNNTARRISELSHSRAWDEAAFGEEIPYHSVYKMLPSEASEEDIEWALQQEKVVETEKSRGDSVVYASGTDFRRRILQGRT